MATLEIHDGRNQVRRVRITRENPAMFGSDPMCDIVLDGPGIQPFHGRIRWKTRRFKADASPEVPWIEVNGLQVKSKSLYQGDEIRVGHCRIFLLSLEDGPDHGEKTVVQEHPTARGSTRPEPEYHRMEMAPPSTEAPAPRPPKEGTPESPFKRSKQRRSSDFDDVDEAISGKEKGRKRRRGELSTPSALKGGEMSAEMPAYGDEVGTAPIARNAFRNLFGSFERAPGDDRVLNSPLVIGLAVTFMILVAFSFALWGTISRAIASNQYNAAAEDMAATNYTNAIKGFDAFLASNSTDKRASKARVLRALARVRQHTGDVGASWGNAVTEARKMVEEVGQTQEYRDSSLELADDLRKAAEGLADRAAEYADPKGLVEAESAVQLHAMVAGPAAGSLIERSKIPEKLARARAAIRKSQDRVASLASMDAALKARKPGDAYASRDALVLRYADLAVDKEVVRRVGLANEQVQQGVRFDPSGRPGETAPREESAGPPTSLVLRLEAGKPPTSPNGPVAFALADGLAFGLDAATGAPRWQTPVGPSSPFPPLAVAGDPPSCLVVDARFDELTRRNARTGALIWRQTLEGPVADVPLLLGNQILQPTLDGRLVQDPGGR
jgi:hypothetical protein